MERELSKDLLLWKEKKHRKPLILKGVRQCGKTHLLKEFGRLNYEDVAYFNFEENEIIKTIFEDNLNAERIVSDLSLFRNKKIEKEKSLIILDEIQFCEKAITSLKYFCENTPEYHIVCAGSLLGISLAKQLSFPVGKVDFLTLYPMNFHEFLKANKETMICEYLEEVMNTNDIEDNTLLNSNTEIRIPEAVHEKLKRYLFDYYITGGMPEVVRRWGESRDIKEIEVIQKGILDSYELDFAKHAPKNIYPKLAAIWRSIPEQMAKENSKFIFSQVKKGLRAKDLEDALEWLISAGLVCKVCKIEKPHIPISAYADQSFFKLYLCDVGLLRKLAGVPATVVIGEHENYREFKGALTENYTLCEMIASGIDTPFYWKSNNIAEVDFILQIENEIVPIEVKSGASGRSKSLAEYIKKYKPNKAVKTSLKTYSSDGIIYNIPLYMVRWLSEIMKI